MQAKDQFRERDLYGPRGYIVHDLMCDEIDNLRTNAADPEALEVIGAAIAWHRDRIPKTSTSTIRVAERLSLAVRDLLAARARGQR